MNNPPAFPTVMYGDEPGMTLRDYFAAQALPAVYADTASVANVKAFLRIEKGEYDPRTHVPLYCAKVAYHIADAMLREREKGAQS